MTLAFAIPARAPASTVMHLGHGGWCWFADPRAVYVRGRIVTGWIDWRRNVVIASLGPHGVTKRIIGTEDAPLNGPPLRRGQRDDHGNPAFLLEPDGRITAFYSGHGGPYMRMRTTLRPGDISEWGPPQVLPTNVPGAAGFTYPNPVRLADEQRTYLFWRGGTSQPTFSVLGSGGAWAPARLLIYEPGERPYLKVASNDLDTIYFAFTNAHPRDAVTNIYFAEYRAGVLYHADGTPIEPLAAAPLRPSQADEVYDARSHGGARAWIWDVAAEPDGNPVLVYAVVPGGRSHRYYYARWNGRAWVSHDLGRAGAPITVPAEHFYSGGVVLDHRDPSIVYASVGPKNHHEIEKLTTPDGGRTWRRRWITHAATGDNVRPVVPRGLPAGKHIVLWLHGVYDVWVHFETSVVARRPHVRR